MSGLKNLNNHFKITSKLSQGIYISSVYFNYMHEVLDLLNSENKIFKTSDHLAYVTYHLVKDNKLIIAITENLEEAMKKAIEAVLS